MKLNYKLLQVQEMVKAGYIPAPYTYQKLAQDWLELQKFIEELKEDIAKLNSATESW